MTTARSTHARWALGALAACACLALFVGERGYLDDLGAPHAEELRAKAAGPASGQRQTWAAFQVFHVSEQAGQAQPLGPALRRSDGLLFGYTNLGAAPSPWRYLLVFGVDADAQVRWFHPAYEQSGTDPSSVPIAENQVDRLLPDVIHHDYALGPMTLYALFTRAPLHVSEVEDWLQRTHFRPTQPPLADALLRMRALEVAP